MVDSHWRISDGETIDIGSYVFTEVAGTLGPHVNVIKAQALKVGLHHASGSRKINLTLCKKATIHQITTMLATSKNILFPG